MEGNNDVARDDVHTVHTVYTVQMEGSSDDVARDDVKVSVSVSSPPSLSSRNQTT